MSNILIKGGQKLNGRVHISGSKNSVTKVLIACVLTKDICILENAPQISDVDSLLKTPQKYLSGQKPAKIGHLHE